MRFLLPALFLSAPAVLADPIEMIVHRQAESVEIYVSLPADEATPFFGSGLDGLTRDGIVPMDAIRRDGTARAADRMIAGTSLSLDGRDAELQAMSVMVHPKGTPLHFETPIDAQMAMSVCTAPDLVAGSTLPDLRAYAGFHAWPVDGYAPLTLTPGGDTPREVRLSVFRDGTRILSERRDIGPDAPLELEGAASPQPLVWPFAALSLAALAVAAALARRATRRGRPA